MRADGTDMSAALALCSCGVRGCPDARMHANAYVQWVPFSRTRNAMRKGRRRRGSGRRRG